MIDDARRMVRLDGGHNFRDLGGYPTQDGGTVAKGKIFRSGNLAGLTPADHEIIRTLGLRMIFDLRSTEERRRRPSHLPADHGIDLRHREYAESAADLLRRMAAPGGTVEKSRAMMRETYRTLAYEQADSYRVLFNCLAEGSLPVLFHCTVGKDRTGIAAALLLETLGVARETVIADYLLTEQLFEAGMAMAMRSLNVSVLAATAPEIWAPLLRADRDYLTTMFETLEQRHGSVAGFMTDVLGIGPQVQAQLRARLCIP